MKIDIHIANKGELIHIGYLEAQSFNAEECFHLCNWECWSTQKPYQLHSNISECSHGICFTNPITNELWLALSVGWMTGSREEVEKYILKNKDKLYWTKEKT